MEQLLFMEGNNSFETFLKLCHAYYMSEIEGTRKTLIEDLERVLMEVKIEMLETEDENNFITIRIRGHFINRNKEFEMSIFYDKLHRVYSLHEYNFLCDVKKLTSEISGLYTKTELYDTIRTLYALSLVRINRDFSLKDQQFQLSIDFPKEDYSSMVGRYARIRIKNNEKIEIFYYDMINGAFFIKVNNKLKMVNPRLKEQILSVLPNFSLKEVGNLLSGWIERKGKKVYLDGTDVIEGSPSIWKRIFGEDYPSGHIIEMPKKEEITQDNSLSLSELLVGSGKIVELGRNSQDIKTSIKSLLSKLKDQEFDRKTFSKIRISEELLFSSVTPSKKEIDEFFRDPKIMELCDLSKIDFTNADIAGFSFEGTGAKIELSKVFGQSIKDTNLRGINLWGQDLDGILADGADLRDTGISVSIETTSIVGTKFSSSSTFMNGNAMISDDVARMMGINIEEAKETDFKMTV